MWTDSVTDQVTNVNWFSNRCEFHGWITISFYSFIYCSSILRTPSYLIITCRSREGELSFRSGPMHCHRWEPNPRALKSKGLDATPLPTGPTSALCYGDFSRWRNGPECILSLAMNEWCFRPRFCTVMAILGRGQPGYITCLLPIALG